MKCQSYRTLVRLCCFYVCLHLTATVSGQPATPGGVKGLRHWFAIAQKEGKQQWFDRVGNHAFSIPLAENSVEWLNGHPSLSLDHLSSNISITLPTESWARSTIVSLFQVQDTFKERIIWRVAQPGEIGVVLSTRRLGDVTKGRYFSNPKPAALHPMLHTYLQHLDPISAHPTLTWHLGHAGDTEELPILRYQGRLPTLLWYNRVLSPLEQQQINSHLALQYGISLPQSHYYNAAGEIIWNHDDNQKFPNRITGIGHDPSSGLYQKRSSSQMEAAPLLEMSIGPWTHTNAANQATLPPGHFLIWGDDGARLRFEQPDPEDRHPVLLERKWLMDATANETPLATELRMHSRELESLLQGKETLWLAIDETGKGDFSFDHTRYYPASRAEDGVLTFSDVKWDTDHSGKDVFSFALGVPFITIIDAQEPRCEPIQTGELRLRVIGSGGPFSVHLTGKNELETQARTIEEQQVLTWTGMEAGTYRLQITAADGTAQSRAITLPYEDAPAISLASQYRLEPNVPLVLSATEVGAAQTDVTWTWPDGKVTYGPELSTQEPGTYWVQVMAKGCPWQQMMQILPPLENFITEWQLYPNPVSVSETFELRLSLDQERSLEVQVIDAQGQVQHSRFLSSAVFHSYTHRLPAAGTYQLLIRAGQQHFTLPIIAQ